MKADAGMHINQVLPLYTPAIHNTAKDMAAITRGLVVGEGDLGLGPVTVQVMLFQAVQWTSMTRGSGNAVLMA